MQKISIFGLLSFVVCGYANGADNIISQIEKTTPTQKIGYVKLESIISPEKPEQSAHEWRDKVQSFQKEMESRKEKLMPEIEKFRKEANEFGTKGKDKWLSEEARQKRERELLKQQSELAAKEQSFREYATQTSQKMQLEMIAKVEKMAQKIGDKKNLDLVLAGGALYVNPNIDLTTEVLTALNKEYATTQKKEKPIVKK